MGHGSVRNWRSRQRAGNAFERFKLASDSLLSRLGPGAIAKLADALDRAASANAEDWAAATLSCRRVLKDFADAVYPPRDEKVEGRNVTDAHYKNRLWAFARERGQRRAEENDFLSLEEVDGLCKGLDRAYDLAGKGIHAAVERDEADLAVLRTYILLAQLAPRRSKCHSLKPLAN